MRKIDFPVPDDAAGMTIFRFCRRSGVSYTGYKHAKYRDGILLDGHPVHARTVIRPGQVVSLLLEDEPGSVIRPYPVLLDIAYEDDDLLIVSKPAPLPSLRSRKETDDTLENAVYAYLGCPDNFVYRPVNRLDKGTSGLMVIAKNAFAQQRLQKQLHTPEFVREYEAILCGVPPETHGTVCLPIARAEDETTRRTIAPNGQEAVTHYRVLAVQNDRAHVHLTLDTGRTHQIRVHMKALGCPVVGDYLYGTESLLLPGRFALHSCSVTLSHPVTGEKIACVRPLPDGLRQLMEVPMTLNERVAAMEGGMVSSLQKLVSFNTVENKGEEGTPFGAANRDCLNAALDMAREMGMRAVNVDGMCGYAEIGEGDEMVALVGHLDVVPVGDGWHYPPFGGVVENGRIYGRGTQDDKGPCIAALYAMKAVLDAGIPLKRRVRLLFGLNEETGSEGIRYYREHGGELPVMGFTPDGEYPIVNGEKGIVTSRHRFPMTKEAYGIRAIHGGIASNVVPDKAYVELNCPAGLIPSALPDVTVTPIEGGFRIDALGVSAHGSTPALGVNAIGRLLLSMKGLPLGEKSRAFVNFMNTYLNMDTTGHCMGIDLADEVSGGLTVNLGIIDGNEEQIDVTINARVPVTIENVNYIAPLKKLFADNGFACVSCGDVHGIYMAPETELIQILSRVYERQTGDKATLMSIGGGTYAKSLPNIVAFGPIFPGDPVVEHQPDEFILIDRLVRNAQIIADAVSEMAGADNA